MVRIDKCHKQLSLQEYLRKFPRGKKIKLLLGEKISASRFLIKIYKQDIQILVCVRWVTHHVWLFATTWSIACQARCPWDFPSKNTGVGCRFPPQGIFQTQRSNLCLLRWQADSSPLSYLRIPIWLLTSRLSVEYITELKEPVL